ncbi:AAA family ATPase [Candidatus Binatia bacterium]|nr:AAA family ATPase [Candidatus Binatia bacterium]
MQDLQFVFPPFRLDPASQQLWHGEALVALRPKLFAVLRYLVENSGRLVTRAELCRAVWPATAISESVVRGTIRELREVLGDEAAAARFIETVPHRGYRFVASVTSRRAARGDSRAGPEEAPGGGSLLRDLPLTGRDRDLSCLQQWLDLASRGSRQVVFVTGEPGIGKTTLVDAFLGAAAAAGNVAVVRGQCVEQYGSGEAYLPVLEALGQLCRRSDGAQTLGVLSRHAPNWLVQMPGLLGDPELEALQRRVQGATRERMLRELADAIDLLTAERTLVLLLEDLHWSDYSTLDVVSFLAQRRTPARLMVLGTYRPADVIVSDHPLKAIKQELRVHEQCEELPLRCLTGGEVDRYLAARFPGGHLPPGLGAAIHHSTEGNPLFVVNVVNYWLSEGLLVDAGGRLRLMARLDEVAARVPDSLRQMIEKQIGRLTSEECRVLEVAGVAGADFTTAVVAAGLADDGERVEERCERLAQRQQFLRARGTESLADGTVTGRYGFLHALYRQVFYERVGAARRVRLHRRIGDWEEQAHGREAGQIAVELAMHFERGHDTERALHYLTRAGDNALRRSAHPEAVGLFTRGLDLLMTLPETPERTGHEIALRSMLGAALGVMKGYAATEVGNALQRAFELCQQATEPPQVFPVVAGLWAFRYQRGELRAAEELTERLFRVAQSTADAALLLWAHALKGLTLSMLGQLSPAVRHLDEGIALYDPQLHGPDRTRVGAQDPKVLCLSFAATTLWRLGYPDEARRRVDEALAWAQELSHPFSLAFGLGHGGAGVGIFIRDMSAVRAHTDVLAQVCEKEGFRYWLGWGRVWRGRALAEEGEPESAIRIMHEGMATVQQTGAWLAIPYVLGQLAEVHGMAGQIAAGLELLLQARSLIEATGERWYEAEIHRLMGELLLQAADPAHPAVPIPKRTGRTAAAPAASARRRAVTRLHETVETHFRTALDVARRQQARSLELRAVMSLSRLWEQQGKRRQARESLADVYGWFTEGFDTPDLRDARALLAALA